MYSRTTISQRLSSPLKYEIELSKKYGAEMRKTDASQFKETIESLNAKIKDYENLTLRQRAEMENYSRAKEKEISRITLNASHDVIRNILPVVDALDSAIGSSKEADNLRALRTSLLKVLEKYGLREIPAKGEKFDPFLHEAVAVVNAKEDGIIQEEYQKGYKLNDEVLRTSKVVVGKKGD